MRSACDHVYMYCVSGVVPVYTAIVHNYIPFTHETASDEFVHAYSCGVHAVLGNISLQHLILLLLYTGIIDTLEDTTIHID